MPWQVSRWKAWKQSWPTAAGNAPVIGVLSLQGDVNNHFGAFERLGVAASAVRTPTDLARVDALVIPGGESTTMWMLAQSSGCFDAISERLRAGMVALGTCAGMIMLASKVLDGRPDQQTFGAIDITVRRNAFGRQVASFESDLDLAPASATSSDSAQAPEQTLAGEPYRAVFIRAPWVEHVGPGVEVLATVPVAEGSVEGVAGGSVAVLCREGNVLVSSFHPELTDDLRIHQMFLELVAA